MNKVKNVPIYITNKEIKVNNYIYTISNKFAEEAVGEVNNYMRSICKLTCHKTMLLMHEE